MKKIITFAALCLPLMGASCFKTTGIDADQAKISEGTRGIVGTSLVGAKGKTRADDRKIGATVARLCSNEVWTKAECANHDRASAE